MKVEAGREFEQCSAALICNPEIVTLNLGRAAYVEVLICI
jgi:hypothetical protein